MRKSPVTLFELIIELKNIEKAERRRQRLPPADSLLYDADDVVGIAHEEGYQESSMTTLIEFLEGIGPDAEMTLSELCTNLGWGIPEVYIPLLFLALDGRCALRQEEFFGDIFVQICRAERSRVQVKGYRYTGFSSNQRQCSPIWGIVRKYHIAECRSKKKVYPVSNWPITC